MDQALDRARQPVALVMARRLDEARAAADFAASLPESDQGAYNLACNRALAGQRGKALEFLRRSLELGLGLGEPDAIAQDAAFSSLRADREFLALLKQAASRDHRTR